MSLLLGLTRAVEFRVPSVLLELGVAQKHAVGTATDMASLCPPGTLPDANVCVPVPERPGETGPALAEQRNQHRDRFGEWREYDNIPRLPERPADFRRYRLPIPPQPGQNFVISGYDLDRPDAEQRRGAHLKAVGHGGVDIAQRRGTEVKLVNLEKQVGDSEVLHVGPLFGNSVVTRHSVREGGMIRDYIIIYGHLQGAAPGLKRLMNLREGSLLGYVGDSGSPGDVHLHFEVRRVREGINAQELGVGQLNQNAKTVACDPRNVLPLLP
jgi:murein DD-endopeptidase MepM/ murein hydrolase activator NlpD